MTEKGTMTELTCFFSVIPKKLGQLPKKNRWSAHSHLVSCVG